jgi:ribosomal protein L32
MPLVFCWNTLNVTEGNYTLSAEASAVPGEINIENNKFVDDVVWIKLWTFPPVWGIPMWLLALLFGLAPLFGVCLISALLYVLWRRRRKRKRQRSTQLNSPRGVGFKKIKTCGACGKQFNGVHTFCPYCFTFHGKDY